MGCAACWGLVSFFRAHFWASNLKIPCEVSAACAQESSGTLRAHGAVLRSASPVLNALLSAPMKEGAGQKCDSNWTIAMKARGLKLKCWENRSHLGHLGSFLCFCSFPGFVSSDFVRFCPWSWKQSFGIFSSRKIPFLNVFLPWFSAWNLAGSTGHIRVEGVGLEAAKLFLRLMCSPATHCFSCFAVSSNYLRP